MLVKARCSNSNEWGFLEKYETYQYDKKGYIKAIVSVTMEGKLAPVYAFRSGEFIPLSTIDEEVGIDRYIKAKKPFYSKVRDGFLVVLKAEVNFKDKEYYPERATYDVYTPNVASSDATKGLPFKKVLDVPKEFENIVREPLKLLGESFGDREKFLRGRL